MLALRGPAAIDIEGTVDGVGFAFTATALDTAEWVVGHYTWAAVVDADGEKHVAAEGVLEVCPDPLSDEVRDARTHARRVLASIEAVIEARATKDQQSYKINDRELVRTPLAELIRLRVLYRAEVALEDRKAAGKPNRLGRRYVARLP